LTIEPVTDCPLRAISYGIFRRGIPPEKQKALIQ
jgi:hypothetical protein